TDCPIALATLIGRMLAKDPAARPTVTIVMEELGALRLGTSAAIPPSPGLTRGEQRLISVVLAAAGDWKPGSESDGAIFDLIRAAAEAYGGAAERLADGSIVIALTGTGAATDQAIKAARCSLAVRAFLADAAIALATGRGVVESALPAAEAIDRAAGLLSARGGNAAAPGILIDAATAGLLDTRFEVSEEGGFHVLVAERELAEDSRTLLGNPSPTVGRDRELQTLDALFDECVNEPAARVALVTAPAGIGKSRVRHDFLNAIKRRENPVIIWIGRGDPISAGSPFGMIAPAIRRAAGILDGEPLAMRQLKLRVRVARHLTGPDARRATEFLGELIGVGFPDEQSIELRAAREDTRLMGDQMLRAWQDWLMAECSAQPVLIVLEDLHWGDIPTVNYTDAALRHLRDHPLMVLALARPEVHELFPKLWAERSTQEIRLGALTHRASEQLVREVLGETVAEEMVARVVSLAAGNAFYLEELMRAVAADETDTLPETVLAMAEARLHTLKPELRRVLRAASLFGQSFWRDGLTALLGGGQAVAGIDELLRELAHNEVITRHPASRFVGQEEYQFRHDLVRAATYGMLTNEDRMLGHRLAGEWLERAGEQEAMTLAAHFERGGEPLRAIEHYLKAARQALEGDDLPSAIVRAETGVACGASGETLGMLRLVEAEAHAWLAAYPEAVRAALDALVNLSVGTNAFYRAAQVCAWGAFAAGDTATSERASREMLRVGPAGRITPYQAAQLAQTAAHFDVVGRHAESDDLIKRAEESLLPGEADPTLAAHLFAARALQSNYRGDVSGSILLLPDAIASFERTSNLRFALLHRGSLAFSLIQTGSFVRAEAELREILRRTELHGMSSSHISSVARQNLALALMHQGRLAEADALLATIVTTGSLQFDVGTRIYQARLFLLRGDTPDAARAIRNLLDRSRSFLPYQAFALAMLATALLRQGLAEEALAAAAEGMAILDQLLVLEEGESLLRLAHAEALEATGHRTEARAAICRARDRLHERAAKISDPELRASFLANIPERARTLELAKAWLESAPPTEINEASSPGDLLGT
ncbi:MAG: AAA family ATPase, partial [Candidatus Eisenbacteria bacterium]